MSARIVIATVVSSFALAATAAAVSAQDRGDCEGREAEGWSIEIAGPDEPGSRLVVEGRVLANDGTPVAGATILVFHTDAEGYYSPGGSNESNARLCGLMLTDEDGRYRFETIRPAHYPTAGAPPAHIHYRVWGPQLERQSLDLYFAGDPRLGMRGRGAEGNDTWASIRPVEELGDGTLHVVRDLRLR